MSTEKTLDKIFEDYGVEPTYDQNQGLADGFNMGWCLPKSGTSDDRRSLR